MGPGTKILEHWLLHTQERKKEDNFSCEGSQVFFTLFHSEHFRFVLLSLVMSSHKDTNVLAKQFLLQALMRISDSSSEMKELLSHINSEVASCFKCLFMESLHPDCQKVRSLLQVLTAVMQITSPDPVTGRLNIKLFYHVVAYAGDRDASDTVILKECFACLLGMTKAAAADQALAAVPVMVQNTGFLQHLQLSLTSQINSFSALALSLLAWIVSNCPPYLNCSPISLSVAFLIDWLAHPGLEGPLSALQILCKVLEAHINGRSCPVLQVKYADSLLEDGHLLTSHEVRLLFCLILQYVCWGDNQTRQCSIKTLGKLIDICHINGKEIGEHLVHHPWKPQLMHALLNSSSDLGLSEHTLQLISQIWREDDFADKKLTSQLLESLKATEVNKENKELFATILEKIQYGCKDKRELQALQSKVLQCNSPKNYNTAVC
ncbi:uncharacterized protein LOC112559021 isoform X2 [Pomacea canaliculata]|uniref:uncharacterized protein LOC112559021 isoform X2 n=1 Tax=Pomacea canaliculata TaxID=400727 RepID=UPI000D73FC37|nr:uncharacterized protein LOC112559021 isoform X2 [Pomacea canaliculata]